MSRAENELEKDKGSFSIKGLSNKESAKILLHILAHPLKGTKSSVKFPVVDGWNVEESGKCVSSFVNGTLWVSSHPDNLKVLKERVYHFIQCTCGIDFAVEQTNTFDEALNYMKKKKARK